MPKSYQFKETACLLFTLLVPAMTCCLAGTHSYNSPSKSDLPAFDFPENADPERVGRLITEDLLSRDYMIRAAKDGIHYAENHAADGALIFADLTGNEGLFSRLKERYSCYLEKEGCSLIPDTGGYRYQAAMIVLNFYLHSKDPKYLDIVLELVQDRWNRLSNPYSEEELFATARFWADDMYTGPTVDPRIFALTGDPLCIDRPAYWLSGYIDRLQLPNGLFRHTTEIPFIWGRGAGWSAAGLTNILEHMPTDHQLREKMLLSYQKLMAGLIPYQSPNGLWRQLIDNPDSWEETSGTAMFTYAMATGIREGWLDSKEYGPVLRKAWLALVDHLDEDGKLKDVCIGTNDYFTAKGYLDRPRKAGDHHGQAPMLWTVNALIRLERARQANSAPCP